MTPLRGGYPGGDGVWVLWRLLVLVILAVVGGLLLAPWVARGIVALGRTVEAWAGLREIPFVRVASRCVLGMLVVGGGVWGMRGGFGSLKQVGLAQIAGWRGGWLAGFCFGVGTMGLVYGVGWGMGVYVWGGKPAAAAVAGLLAVLGTAVLVGLVEEVLFRGVLFGALRACCRWWVAAAGASVLFALVHFATPVPRTGIAHPHWHAGLALLPDLFRKVHADSYYVPFGWSLVVMGLVLCLVYDRYRSLYPVWGMHAGWVWVLYGWGDCLERLRGMEEGWFGVDDNPAKGTLVLVLLSAMAAGLVAARVARPRRQRDAGIVPGDG
jgi:membrane protease YdiL (CAAX protease family)